MKVNNLISISPGFQRSVNIKLDISNSDKVSSYIPTEKSETIIEHVSSALTGASNEGAVMLIGSYGTGKSHLTTFLASLAGHTVPSSFQDRVIEKIGDLTLQASLKEISAQNPYLVVAVSGSDELRIDHQLLRALKRSLHQKDINISLSTSFTAALEILDRWNSDYPDTYSQLNNHLLDSKYVTAENLRVGLSNISEEALRTFAEKYPLLTSGANFDFLAGGVDEVYQSACLALPQFGYKGIMLIFDEFNKVMDHSLKDRQALKIIQDLAELACRSDKGYNLNMVLISHRTISQYVGGIDIGLANEWRKIEGRFRIFDVSNKPWETYELIGRVLKKNKESFFSELLDNNSVIQDVSTNPRLSQIFEGLNRVANNRLHTVEELIIKGCLPLHPVSVFLLPRVSAKLAQNERTLFTFLSGNDGSPIPEALDREIDLFEYVLPWQLYDYFEGQLSRSSDQALKAIWTKVSNALESVQNDDNVLAKALKTIGLLQIAGNNVNLPCTVDLISYGLVGLDATYALNELEHRKLILIRAANQEIDIVEPTDFDPEEAFRDWEEKRNRNVSPFEVLPTLRKDYVVPHRYNHQFKMTRYLSPLYLGEKDWDKHFPLGFLAPEYDGLDGVICFVLPETSEQLAKLEELVNANRDSRVMYVLPERAQELTVAILRTTAFSDICQALRELKADERVIRLAELYFQDYMNVLNDQLAEVTLPSPKLRYVSQGKQLLVRDELDLSEQCSLMMEAVYNLTPKFNNELINKSTPTLTSRRARNDVINGVLNELPGLRDKLRSAQERFMLDTLLIQPRLFDPDRSLLTKVWPEGYEVLNELEDYFKNTSCEKADFQALLQVISAPPYGVRTGVIPALLAVCIVKLKEYVTIKDSADRDCQIDAALLDKILENPQNYFIKLEAWNSALEKLTIGLAEIYGWSRPQEVFFANEFYDLGYEIFKWFSSLPRFSRESQKLSKDARIVRNIAKIAAHRPRQTLLTELPNRLGYQEVTEDNVAEIISKIWLAKSEIDIALTNLNYEVLSTLQSFLQAFGNPQESLKSLALNMITELSTGGVSLDWSHVIAYVSEFRGYDESEFTSGLIHKLTGVRLEDWLDTTHNDLTMALDTIEKAHQQAAVASSGPRVELLFYSDGCNDKITLQTCEVSPLGEALQDHLESAVNNFGDAISSYEKRQILLNLLRKVCR